MSFELIDNIDEEYPTEHFTRESVYKVNLKKIVDKLKEIIVLGRNKIKELQTHINDIEQRIEALEAT